MLCFPNAKINLGLHIVARRPDGYHDLETVFYPIPLTDALEIVPADRPSFTRSGLQLDGEPADDLVMKALHALQQQGCTIPTAAIYLRKAIPAGAGLGGGSADAAFMLKLLNEYAQLGLTTNQLEATAATIGADCPFFIGNRPALATGTGNLLQPIELSLAGYRLALVKPNIHISTKEAYAHAKPAPPAVPLADIIARPIAEWRETMKNDFEASISPRYPIITAIKERLYAQGAVYAAMSGSGSAVYGLFADAAQPVDLRFPDCFVWQGVLT